MKTIRASMTVAVLACALPVLAQTAHREADAAAIGTLLAGYQAAYNSHDAKAAAAFYATGGSRRTADGRVIQGRAAVERQLADDFAGAFKAAKVTFDAAFDLQYPDAITAIVDGSAQLAGVAGPGGQPRATARYLHTIVVVKREGEWQILALRNWPSPAR